MENFDKQFTPALLGLAVNTIALLSYQYLGIIWILYISMGLISIVIVTQTLAAAILFSGVSNPPKNLTKTQSKNLSAFSLLLGVVYFAVCYQLYLLGFVVFVAVAVAHIIITSLSHILRIFAKE